MKKNRVVITGMGLVSPIGLEIKQFWQNIVQGQSGIGYIKSDYNDHHPITVAAEISDDEFDIRKYLKNRKQKKYLNRSAMFAMAASDSAIEDANLSDSEIDRNRIGVYMGTLIGHPEIREEIESIYFSKSEEATFDAARYCTYIKENINPINTLKNISSLIACHIAIAYDFRGSVNTYIAHCISGSQAIEAACAQIKYQEADLMIAGGTEATIFPQSLLDFAMTYPLAQDANGENPRQLFRPFDEKRSGAVVGEGAAALVLESLDHALNRGATIYGEIIGYGSGLTPRFYLNPQPEISKAIASSMKKALAMGKVDPSDVDYINANGDATFENDKAESQAIKEVFGDAAYQIPISSTKPMTGHMLSASGPLEAIVSVLAMNNNNLPQTLNCGFSDPDCNLDYIREGTRPAEMNLVLSNAINWYGQSESLLIKRYSH